jgi:hypothetical protein
MLGDKAYDSAELREDLYERGTKPVIPNRCNRKQPFSFKSGMRRCCLWHFDMGCELPSFAGSNGRKSALPAQPYMYVGSKNGKAATHPHPRRRNARIAQTPA